METQSQSIGKITAALVEFQREAKGVKKTAENPYFHSKYAELSDVWDEIRAPLAKNGLAVVQTFIDESLVTTLAHTSGEWFRGALKLSPKQANDPQAQGSAITYARRYALQAITGIAPIDDDGNAASGRTNQDGRQTQQDVHHTTKAASAHESAGDVLISSFQLSEPQKSKKGTMFWKAVDREGSTYYVWDNPVVADLQIAGDTPVKVRLEGVGSKFVTIKEVISQAAA